MEQGEARQYTKPYSMPPSFTKKTQFSQKCSAEFVSSR